jgi:hypothetical protein
MPLLSGAQARRHAESYPYPLLARVLAGRRLDRSESSVRFDVLVKTVEALKWETLLLALWPRRRGRFALSDGDARRSDPYGNRARSIAYVAFAALLNKSAGRKAAQEKGEVTQTDEDAHEVACGVGEDAC